MRNFVHIKASLFSDPAPKKSSEIDLKSGFLNGILLRILWLSGTSCIVNIFKN